MMNRSDPTTADVHRALSTVPSSPRELSRRFFLQAAAAAGGAAMLPLSLAEMAAAATPIGATDGVLVIVWMNGGNDGLNTVVPFNEPRYYDLRPGVAIAGSSTLAVSQHRGLHPELGYLQSLANQGQVAFVDGVGDPDSDLSHFESTARWMTGRAGHGAPTSGWVGRYIDGLPGGADPFHAVHVGRSVPLQMQGNQRQATALPINPSGIFDPADDNEVRARQMAAIDAMASGSTGLGLLGDALADAGRQSLTISNRLAPTYNVTFPDDGLSADLLLAARLINADLGIRVLNVEYGDFDGHAGHPPMHRDRMREFNAALQLFHQSLDARFADRTTVLTVSEFGRRARSNNSAGTDHGSASTLMAIGPRVIGGFYGEFPSLNALDRRGNQVPTVDFRAVYATVLETWLGADPAAVLGANYENLGFLRPPTSSGSGGGGAPPPAVANLRSQIMRLYLAYFQRLPEPEGLAYWVDAARAGLGLAAISQVFADSPEFQARYGTVDDAGFVELVYQNVLGRSSDASGRNYWVGAMAGGTTRGEVMVGFSESDEFAAASADQLFSYDARGPVARLYQAYFLRFADPDGLAYWNNTAMPMVAISDAFAESDEFRQRYGSLSNQAFVELVYQNVMGREPDAAGLAFWVDHMYRGLARGEVMLAFSESPEFIARFAAMT